ncbi:MAG: VTT domain-containing protein [Candidatus Eisenbacteria bacterium]|nr:VTT domain-containing protein [Candidatus Eisenbacteria bacterium]
MNLQHLFAEYGLYPSTFLVCFVSGFIPVVNAEVYLAAVSMVAPKFSAFPLAFTAASGQMIAKSIIYLAGRGVLRLPIKRYEKKMDRVAEQIEAWGTKTGLFTFISAFTGFPPFYAVSFLAGVLNVKFQRFFLYGFLGRLLRFFVVVLFPRAVGELIK